MKPVCGEFLKGGALSVDKLIEERAPPVLKYLAHQTWGSWTNCGTIYHQNLNLQRALTVSNIRSKINSSMISKVKMIAPTYTIENAKSAYENEIIIFFLRDPFSRNKSLFIFITPPEGPLWKQGLIDLFNAIPAIFNLGCF